MTRMRVLTLLLWSVGLLLPRPGFAQILGSSAGFPTPLVVPSGGTGLSSGTSGGVLAFTGPATLASSALLTANAIVLGGGAGNAPTVLGSLGTTTTVLHGNAAGAPTFGYVSLTADVSGILPVANGGTGLATLTANYIPYGAGTGAFASNAGLTFDGTTFKTLAAHFLGSAGSPAGQAYIKSAAAGTIGLVVDTAAAPTAFVQEWRLNGAAYAYLKATTATNEISTNAINLGNDIGGSRIYADRNTSAGAVGPAAGVFGMAQANGTSSHIWTDAAAKLRINASPPTGSSGAPTVSDTAGTVVGDQTSWWEAKEVIRQWDDPTKALEAVLATPVYDFRYKDSTYLDADNQPAVFTGIVGFDRRDPFLKNVGRQQTPALNEISLHGYTILSIQALHRRIVALEERAN